MQGMSFMISCVQDFQIHSKIWDVTKRLLRPFKRAAGALVEELPLVLWSLRMTPNSSTGYTPFFLLFGAEAVFLTEVRYCAPRVVAYVEEDAQTALEDALDLLDEA
jgi:hypothetical protein